MSFVPGPFELVLILVVVLILFGAGRLPQVFESFGKGIKAFRQAANDARDDDAIEVAPKREIPEDKSVAEAEEVKKAEPAG